MGKNDVFFIEAFMFKFFYVISWPFELMGSRQIFFDPWKLIIIKSVGYGGQNVFDSNFIRIRNNK